MTAPGAVGATKRIGDIAVLATTPDAATALVTRAVAQKAPRIFAFCNAHSVNVARRSAMFRTALRGMTLFNDGVGLDIAGRLLHGARFPHNLNGTDLSPAILAALPPGTAIFLLGTRAEVVARARSVLAARFADLRFVGAESGFFTTADEAALAQRIRDSGAQVVLVGMGQPRQELWAARNAAAVGATLLCIGAYLDFAAGAVARAPGWVRAARLEWAFRLALEPRRLASRYVVGNLSFLAYVVALKLRGNRA